MSAEGKKKRGEAGQSNAKNIAFRYGGSKCDLSTKIGHTTHPRLGGSRFLNAMKFAATLGYDDMSDRSLKAADECMDTCPTVSESGGPKAERRPKKISRHSPKSGIVIRIGETNHDVSVDGGEAIDLSSTTEFTTRGNIHGLIRPTKDMDRASSLIIASLQKRGMFKTA